MIRTIPPGPGRHRRPTGWIADDARASGEDGRSFAVISRETDPVPGTDRAATMSLGRGLAGVMPPELADTETFGNGVVSLTYRRVEA